MASHEFGIMGRMPVHGERYDMYDPEAYTLLRVDDTCLEPFFSQWNALDFFWHSLDVPGKGLAYYGITLIPPSSMEGMINSLEGAPPALMGLKALLAEARAGQRFMIHYGL